MCRVGCEAYLGFFCGTQLSDCYSTRRYPASGEPSPHIFVRIRGIWSGMACRTWCPKLGMTRYLKAGRSHVCCTWLSTEVIGRDWYSYSTKVKGRLGTCLIGCPGTLILYIRED